MNRDWDWESLAARSDVWCVPVTWRASDWVVGWWRHHHRKAVQESSQLAWGKGGEGGENNNLLSVNFLVLVNLLSVRFFFSPESFVSLACLFFPPPHLLFSSLFAKYPSLPHTALQNLSRPFGRLHYSYSRERSGGHFVRAVHNYSGSSHVLKFLAARETEGGKKKIQTHARTVFRGKDCSRSKYPFTLPRTTLRTVLKMLKDSIKKTFEGYSKFKIILHILQLKLLPPFMSVVSNPTTTTTTVFFSIVLRISGRLF